MINGNIKILILGGPGTGKTSVLQKYYNLNRAVYPTIGVEVSSKLIIRNNKVKKFAPVRFYDMGGADYWWFWIPEYCKRADIVFLFYDITRQSSLQEANDILNILATKRNSFRIILVGNKTDKENERKINIFELNKFVQHWRCKDILLTHIETSKYNVTSFSKLLEKILIGIKNIKTPNRYSNNHLNLCTGRKTSSWSDYIFNWH